MPSVTGAFARETNGDLDGALADYDQAIRLNPRDASNFRIRANMRQAKGDLDGALADYNEAIRLQPEYAEAFNNRGQRTPGKRRLGRRASGLQPKPSVSSPTTPWL